MIMNSEDADAVSFRFMEESLGIPLLYLYIFIWDYQKKQKLLEGDKMNDIWYNIVQF